MITLVLYFSDQNCITFTTINQIVSCLRCKLIFNQLVLGLSTGEILQELLLCFYIMKKKFAESYAFLHFISTKMKNENVLERNLHSSMYVHLFPKLRVVIDFLRKSFLLPSSPLSLCLCFLLPCFCLVKIILPVLYPFSWRWEVLHYTHIYNCSILVFSFFPFHQISGIFLCCQLAKYFMQVQQVSHIPSKQSYDGVAVSILDLGAASPGTTANLYIPVQSQ